ncbi:MAG: ferrous iron transport protein A [Candidatus Bathyarchaeota archaeon]|nr:ferrous iron transport protein A [Candidatus Termiticorpusculum sp.]
MSLCSLPSGTQAKITKICGENEVIRRLNEMGFTPGTKIKIIRGEDLHGPVVVEVRDSRIVLGNDVALKIVLAEVE